MYVPKFSISNGILRNIGQIEAAKEVIETAPLVPDFERDFQTDAVVRQVYHGTHIEGNTLSMDQTKQVLDGERIFARDRDVQEVINYRQVVKLLDELKEARAGYDLTALLDIHAAVVYNIVPREKAGKIRETQVVVKEEGSGRIIFSPPGPVELPYLLEDFINWLETGVAKENHPVIIAAIVHYVLSAIHPFVDGNGRAARAFAMLVMLKEGYDIKRFFAIEEHFDRDLDRYYEAFFKVDRQSAEISQRDLTAWIEYFTESLAVELVKIKEKVKKLSIDSQLRVKIGQQISLSPRQMKLVEYLSQNGKAGMRELKEVFPMVSEDTILRDIKGMKERGIIDKEGSTKAAVYVLRR